MVQFKVKTNEFYGYICALAGIFSMNPYFLWPSFCGGIFVYITYILYAISISYILRSTARFKLTKSNFLIAILFFVMYVHIYILGANSIAIQNMVSGLLAYANMFLLTTCTDSIKRNIFEKFVTLFIISLVPGLIYYILENIGVSLSIGSLQSQNQITYANAAEFMGDTGYYKLYIGAVMRVSTNTRFSGIYDEAGLVGTVSALLLVARKFEIRKDKKCRWLLFFSIISFSLASYLLIIIYLFLKWIYRGQWKIIVSIFIGAFVLYGLLNIHTNNVLINNLQDRIQITTTGISLINNRESSLFEKGYEKFTSASISRRILGYGRGASSENPYMNGSSSYKCVVYDYGYFGFGLMMLIIVYCYFRCTIKKGKNDWNLVTLFLIFLISIYQRPAIMYAYYFIILYGGKDYLCFYNTMDNRKKIKEEL